MRRRTTTRSSRTRTLTAGPASQPRHDRAAVPDAGDARDLERGQADELGDHALSDGEFRSGHVATSSLGAGSIDVAATPADAASRVARLAPSAASDSAISSGTRVRAVVAVTSQA